MTPFVRNLTSTVSAGPQWTTGSDAAVVPSSLGFALNAALNYQFAYSSAGINYTRGVNNGAGYLIGGETDMLSADYSRQLGTQTTVGITGGYMRTSGLVGYGTTNAEYGGVQVTRRLNGHLEVFGNYSAFNQSTSSSLPGNALTQIYQVAGAGIEYSPRPEKRDH